MVPRPRAVLRVRPAQDEPRVDPHAFDPVWYLSAYPDVRRAGVDPADHYARFGRAEGRLNNASTLDPSTAVDADWYLAAYPDVREAGIDPAVHYALYGRSEGRLPDASPPDPENTVDPQWYWAAYPDVQREGTDPAVHYALFGRAEGRFPNGRWADPYSGWRRRRAESAAPSLPASQTGPLISLVLPVYKVPPSMLMAMLESLRAQTYPRWEACIAFADPDGAENLALLRWATLQDDRFKLEVLDENLGISGNSNAALAQARGDYVGLLDHDDELAPDALAWIVEAIAREPAADFLYTDKEMISEDGEHHHSPLFKPDWSPETLYSVNYLTHFNVIRTDLLKAVDGWAAGVDGAQDWDLFLRVTERARRIVRAPGVAYSWRAHANSTASGLEAKPYALDAQLKALNRHAVRIGLPGVFVPHSETGFSVAWREVARVRVVVLGSPAIEPLLTLVSHLERERDDFVGVDLLLTSAQRSSLLSCWQTARGDWPSWCEIHEVPEHDLVHACAARLADIDEAVTVFMDGGLLVHTPGALRQLAGWLHEPGAIAFASGVTVESDDRVIEAGALLDEAGVVHPLFRDAPLRRWGMMGGPLWHRNVDTASPYLLALRTAEAREALQAVPGLDWPGAFRRVCGALATGRPGGRGVVDPSARAIVAPGLAFPAPAEAMIGAPSRYLHPFLTMAPGRGIVFNDEPLHGR